ncbi:hypothetical protein GCM10010435_19360 [Winogradskya consettensis]|uniref:Uncharacterized protein n=1 Tax=Winogradskya consettensis TaxID=113560 RepID=A0A919SVR5_9ACTN|nr:hypothetical protein Aco04nite_59690 [Actinoplanes consettensis]
MGLVVFGSGGFGVLAVSGLRPEMGVVFISDLPKDFAVFGAGSFGAPSLWAVCSA